MTLITIKFGNMNYLLPEDGTAARAMYFYVKHSPRPVSFDDLVSFGRNCQSLFTLPRGVKDVPYPEIRKQIDDFRATVGVGELSDSVFDHEARKFVTKKTYYVPPMTLDERTKLKEQLDYFDSMP